MALKILLGGDMRIHYNGQLRTVREYYLEKIHPGVEYAGIRPVKKLETRAFGEVYVGAEHAVSIDKKSWLKANFTRRKNNTAIVNIPDKYKSDALCDVKDSYIKDVKLGIFLGLLVGDGNLGERVRLYAGKKDAEEIIEFVSSIGINYDIYDGKTVIEIKLYFGDKTATEFAEGLELPLGVSFEEKTTPGVVWKNKFYALGYLIGFIASDGYIHKKNVEIYNANKHLLNDVSVVTSEYFEALTTVRDKKRASNVSSSGIAYKRSEYRIKFSKLTAKKVFCGYEHLVPIKRKREALISLTDTNRSLSEFSYQIKTSYRVSFIGNQDVYAIDADDLFWYRGFWIEPVRV